jgi:hypothetical protein
MPNGRRQMRFWRLFVLVACPILLLGTFITMEFVLASSGKLSGFTWGLRRVLLSYLFAPFFLGVLLGHWYHPVPVWYFVLDKRVYGGRQIIPPLIAVCVAIVLMAVGMALYYPDGAAPSYLSFGMVVVGVVFGALIWPVRVFRREVR